MEKDFLDQLRNSHKDFTKGDLSGVIPENPMTLFKDWYQEAFAAHCIEPNAMTLSTVSGEGKPSSRIVYLKELTGDDFIFYTNYKSQKGKEIEENPSASLLFFWPELQRQVRIEGVCCRVEAIISDAYFDARPRESQLGAWASHQSEKLNDPKELTLRMTEVDKRFPNKVPRPEHWGGYALTPALIEFWHGRPSRLHDRVVYLRHHEVWEMFRKNP